MENKIPNKVLDYTHLNGFDNVEFKTKWNGFYVYKPSFNDNKIRYIGTPKFILLKNYKVRFATFEEYKEFAHLIK